MNLIDKNTGEFIDTQTFVNDLREAINRFKDLYYLAVTHNLIEGDFHVTAFHSCLSINTQLINEIERNTLRLEEEIISKYLNKEPIPRRKNENTFIQLNTSDFSDKIQGGL